MYPSGRTEAGSAVPCAKSRVAICGPRARKRKAAGTTATPLIRRARDRSARRSVIRPSAAALLIRGSRAVTRETVTMDWGSIQMVCA